MKRALLVLAFPVAVYLLVCVGMMLSETSLVYPAPLVDDEALADQARHHNARVVELHAEDGTKLNAWRIGDPSHPLLLFFSGNGSRVGGETGRYQPFLDAGFSVLHLSYRGYPGSEGSPHEQGLMQDAVAAWQEARRSHRPQDIVVYGKSLGGGVAMGLTALLWDTQQVRPRALVLESTFTNIWKVGQDQYPWLPVKFMMRNRWDSLDKAHAIRVPTLVLHGSEDTYIPPTHGLTLAGSISGARYLEVAGAEHNHLLWGATTEVDEAIAALSVAAAAEPPALRFAEIPSGSITLAPSGSDAEPTPIALPAFGLMTSHVTVAEFEATPPGHIDRVAWLTSGDDPRCNLDTDRANHPANCVNWRAAHAWCTERGLRLPTEAEWEHAARAGTTTNFWWGQGHAPERLIHCTEGAPCERTAPVDPGGPRCNPWGVCDVSGQLWEWTRTTWGASPHDLGDPLVGDPAAGLIRGGSMVAKSGDPVLEHGYRSDLDLSKPNFYMGFRCVREGPPTP